MKMKRWIVLIGVAVILGVGINLVLKNSHIDIFPGTIEYKSHTTVNYSGETIQISCSELKGISGTEESKSLSLLAIEQQKESPDACIESIGLTFIGYMLYFVCIVIVPLFFGFILSRILVKRKR